LEGVCLPVSPSECQQQESSSFLGGQSWSLYEQNTQQSPSSGFNSSSQPVHRWKKRQESVGISTLSTRSHFGQVRSAFAIQFAFLQVRELCPSLPQTPHFLRPFLRRAAFARLGWRIGQVLLLWPGFSH
jgi:hypothetical protein